MEVRYILESHLPKHGRIGIAVLIEQRVVSVLELLLRNTHLLEVIIHLRKSQLLCALEAQSLATAFAPLHRGNEHHRRTFLAS